MDGVKFIWNPFSPEARALSAEQRGDYGKALRWYAQARNGEELVAERFRYGLPACRIRSVFIEAACALIRVEQTALRISQDAGTPSRGIGGLADEIEDAADALWRRAHRIGHASVDTRGAILDALYEQEGADLRQLVRSITVSHAALIRLQITGASPLQEQAARFVDITHAARRLARRDNDGD